MTDKYLVMTPQDAMRLAGVFVDDDNQELNVVIKYRKEQKRKIEINGNTKKTARDLMGQIPVVFVCPDDISIVKGGSQERRSFVNKILCQVDLNYLTSLASHNKILRQKSAALKSNKVIDKTMIETFNHMISPHIKEICRARHDFVETIKPMVKSAHAKMSSDTEIVELEYQSQFNDKSIDESLARFLPEEILARRVRSGSHRDDLDFHINEKSLKKYGSQGQIKTFLYALKLAEFEFLYSHLNKKPILILDDIFEKLDQSRLDILLGLIINGYFAQVFISDTELTRTKKILEGHNLPFDTFQVTSGQINKVK